MKIVYLTATRAEYGLMRSTLKELEKKIDLKIAVTGMHLMKEFGKSVDLITDDDFNYEILDTAVGGDSRDAQLKYFSALVSRFSEYLKEKPDYVMIVGDRIEALAAAACCTYLKIPLCHLHGGERTSTVDDPVRHAISKLAHVHFPATEQSKKRLIMMGEEEWRVKVVGSPGAYYAKTGKFLGKKEIFSRLGLGADKELFLVLLHPEDDSLAHRHAKSVFDAASRLDGKIVVVYPNTDPGYTKIIEEIGKHNFNVFKNLEYDMFLSLMKNSSVMIGNSSSAIIEAPSFGTPVVNIGERQRDRERAGNAIDCGFDTPSIISAVDKAKKMKRDIINPYNSGDPAKNILDFLSKKHTGLLHKRMVY